MRIIAGEARGRRFDAPEGMDTRPTLDRVKEPMFGMLQFRIPGSMVLDLFSGSGNLGLEAASRGAKSVVCNDHSANCAKQIRQNVERLGFSGVVSILQMDYAACLQLLAQQGRKFDLIFLDAPYADATAARAANLAAELNVLAADGRIVLEHAPELPPDVDETRLFRETVRRYGKCAITILKGQ